jgi:predicted O-linked N-acetylglucosamine transferase (SPINDLY family)
MPQAEALLRRAVQKDGSDQRAVFWLGRVLFDSGQLAQCVYFLEKAAALNPRHADSQGVLGLAQLSLGKVDEAEKRFKILLELLPENPGALNNLGLVHVQRNMLSAAAECFLRAIRRAPEPALAMKDAVSNYALVVNQLGRADEAVAMLEPLLAGHEGNYHYLQALAPIVTYSALPPRRVFEAHRDLGRLYPELPRPASRPLESNGKRRRLRVGLVSPDYRRHSVAYFLEPILEHRDRTVVEYICYSATPQPDDMTVRLKSLADGWREITGKADVAAAEIAKNDQLDVLVDLAGHTSGNRLAMFMLRPAPVAATYLGYANTTGLACIDWRIVDAITDPPPEADALVTEKLERLPGCFLCYSPAVGAPPPRPARENGAPVVFGSFNAVAKLSPRALDTWTRLLAAAPGSKLLLKANAMTEQATREWFAAEFARRGVEPGRVEIVPFTKSFADHIALYSRVDIALDTFPYAGTTTTCEALSVGVPVVTLAEPIGVTGHAGRVGASVLTAAGAPELIANSVDEYIALAAGLAADGGRLAEYHATLPGRLRASPLCDGPAFARKFEAALVRMFEKTTAPA